VRLRDLLRLVFVSAIILLADFKIVNAQGDPYVDAGADTSVTCSDPCVDLIGSYFYSGQTNTYLPIPIPYTPYPFNVGAAILVNIFLIRKIELVAFRTTYPLPTECIAGPIGV